MLYHSAKTHKLAYLNVYIDNVVHKGSVSVFILFFFGKYIHVKCASFSTPIAFVHHIPKGKDDSET